MNVTFDLRGVKEIQDFLVNVLPKDAARILRNTTYAVAAKARDEVRQVAPVRSGTLKKNVSVKNLKGQGDKPTSAVYFKDDGYYWRFIERGHKGHTRRQTKATRNRQARIQRGHPGARAYPFVGPATERLRGRIPKLINEAFTKVLEKEAKRKMKKV